MQYPEGYKPLAFCRSCGRDFAGTTYFDMHRVGLHEPDERRCATEGEMHEMGLKQLTPEEMKSGRHKHRLEYDVPMWIDPVQAARLSEVRLSSERGTEGSGGETGGRVTAGPQTDPSLYDIELL